MDYFGTHVPIKVMYGASFTNVDRFTSSEYNFLESHGVSVDTQASFASLFNIGVDDFSDSQRQTISQFRNFAETVTKSVGPPPSHGGDSADWARAVQSSPAPINHRFTAIRTLLTYENLKPHMSEDAVQILQHSLKNTGSGIVSTCHESSLLWNVDPQLRQQNCKI